MSNITALMAKHDELNLANSMEQSPWEASSHSSIRNSLPFMEPKGSLPCSQGPTKSNALHNIS